MTLSDTLMVGVSFAAMLVLALFLRAYKDANRPALPQPVQPCATLYRMAHTATDSLYVALQRGDCTP